MAVLGFNALLLVALTVRHLTAKEEEELLSDVSESAADPVPDNLPRDPFVLKGNQWVRTNISNPE
jgi:hypothetical protein